LLLRWVVSVTHPAAITVATILQRLRQVSRWECSHKYLRAASERGSSVLKN
jgi:hypothetical protein